MKDGYYLSVYLHIDELSNLLDFSIRHDQGISLWKKDKDIINLIHYWELERVSGLKMHGKSFFCADECKDMINSLLSTYNLNMSDIIEIWGTPQLDNCNDYHSIVEYQAISYHSVCHLFSSILLDSDIFFNSSIIALAADGGPDGVVDLQMSSKYFYAGCVVKDGNISIFPIYSPGVLWIKAKQHFKMREGTLMALASASKSEVIIPNQDIVLIDNSNTLENAYAYFDKLLTTVYQIVESKDTSSFNGFDPRFSMEENIISIVMKEIQKMSIRIMEYNLNNIINKFNINPANAYLAVSGGYALNCPTNSVLMQKFGFKGFLSPPCVSDSGISLGIALYAFYKKMNGLSFKCNINHAFYGDDDTELSKLMATGEYDNYIEDISNFDIKQFLDDIKKFPIVWFNGRAEIGPRALGHRSIISDPRSESMKNELNRIKGRQWWRPVAPIVLEDKLDGWFEKPNPSPFMLQAFKIKKEKIDLIQAVAHLDGSARIQSINLSQDRDLYCIIQAFYDETGIPMLCNTSLNDKGEPIINKIEEAFNFILRKGIMIAYFNKQRVVFKNHGDYTIKNPIIRPMYPKKFDNDEIELMLKKYNPFNIPRNVLIFYYYNYYLKKEYDIRDKNGARGLNMLAKSAFKNVNFDNFIFE